MVVRKKIKVRCECGKAVAAGSVFCPHCRAEINRKNVKTMAKEERRCQKSMQRQGRARKK